MGNLIIYVCKTCGRALKSDNKPEFCYYDRCATIENISDEDAIKMTLFTIYEGVNINNVIYEFPGDIRFNPFTGEDETQHFGGKLTQLQDYILDKIRGAKA